MLPAKAYAAYGATSPLAPFEINRREPGPHDVLFDILYCGICHSDIHYARGQFFGPKYPVVPGHEIVGKVARVGGAVTRHKVGDMVGVGCLVDSCRTCPECRSNQEQFCNDMIGTYGGVEKGGNMQTYGGYSTRITVDENYVLKIPSQLDPAAAAPLLCAGITTYSPLRHWKAGRGSKVGVIGLGGLGHMAVKLAAAMGAEVTILSTSDSKKADTKRLGASDFANTEDGASLARLSGHFDLILNTVSARVGYDAYISLLKRDGTLVLLGLPDGPVSFNALGLLRKRRNVAASLIGGIRETQEMLYFCAEHGIVSDIETIPIDQVNAAYERILKSDVRYRFIIDMASLL
ncbi:putative oxidoreductase, Zn-dependent and NAD(P)-binding [Georgfuchsia toluolica]|uniref:Oxidoreductase, Zn-dependent and NAD(P)-binding n=1 Tax=Georgfuchsia toluolica TaxID=424218 RepID=A0A916J628_9PROT|nr:NAD(P)-dependent alcohol dehydrogenase [Georgfuchsia toluolica]CAG4885219.1 putative oxidoreductase, Zn-dependent and NAD(P)-binding [Georgfuchsia toluolica]